MSFELLRVRSIDEITHNMRRFCRGAELNAERIVLFTRHTTYWVYDSENGAFGPSTFVGYQNMTFDRYKRIIKGDFTGDRFDGQVSRSAIERLLETFEEDESLNERLSAWLARMTEGYSERIQERYGWKWKFAALPTCNYWSFACDPRLYDALAACRELKEITWASKRKQIKSNDKCIVWQTKSGGKNRGVVGVGEVTDPPAQLPFPDKERPYQLADFEYVTERCRIKLMHYERLPLWLSRNLDLLSSLAVARAHGGTVFSLQPEQWKSIIAELEAHQDEASFAIDHGQGRDSDALRRRTIELFAQEWAENHFIDQGFEVEDVSASMPYDLLCRKGNDELHVEVKGTRGKEGAIVLTKNEVEHAREFSNEAVLFLVHSIQLTEVNGSLRANDGVKKVFRPWDINTGELNPIQYKYLLPSC